MIHRYIENNGNFIDFFSKYYKDGVNIDKLYEQLLNGFFLHLRIPNLSMFRIFLDSCMMLYNKSKLEKEYFKKNFEYKGFNNYTFKFNIEDYYEMIKNTIFDLELLEKIETIDFSNRPIAVYFPDASSKFDEIVRLRNSFAHMQFGNFKFIPELGQIPYYYIYNKDNGVIKNRGVAFEPVIHEFISCYYSNQATYGVPYKHSFFCYNMPDGTISDKLYFYEVTYKSSSEQRYNSDSNIHPMIEYINHQKNFIDIMQFISTDTNFQLKGIKVAVNIENGIIAGSNNKLSKNEIYWFLKLIYDFQTVFSNFLLHLREVVDVLIEWNTRHNLNRLDNEFKILIKDKLFELKEDEDDTVAFQTLFSVLVLYNIMFYTEVYDLSVFAEKYIKAEKFIYEKIDFDDWCSTHYASDYITQSNQVELQKEFLLKKIRNSLAHGNILFEFKDSLNIVMEDKYNNRDVKIKINISDFQQMSKEIDWGRL